jgi:glycine/D-amino acid oxidase-like deaminating enzyme
MAELKADVLVLGAGMVGVGAALHLQKKGRDVVLIDRHELAGEETSYGNGGLIECASVFPYMFPRDLGQILQYAFQPRAAGALSFRRSAGLPALAGALLPRLVAGACAAQRDGRIAADPAQPDRA